MLLQYEGFFLYCVQRILLERARRINCQLYLDFKFITSGIVTYGTIK